MERRIPSRIIQTGRSLDLPLLQQAVVANIRLLNPDFEYCFFDDEGVRQFLDREFPQYQRAFDAFPYRIQKYDFFRYLAVYRYGGFYLDLDVLLASGLAPLRDRGCVFPFDDLNTSAYLRRRHHMDWTVGNYAFGATAGHPFLKAAIENCVRAQEHPEWVEPSLLGIPRLFRDDFVVLNTTGPLLLSRTLAENAGFAHEVAILFPDDVRSPETWHRFGAIGVHLMEGSWRRSESLLRRRLRMFWEGHVFRRFMRESAKLGAARCALPA